MSLHMLPVPVRTYLLVTQKAVKHTIFPLSCLGVSALGAVCSGEAVRIAVLMGCEVLLKGVIVPETRFAGGTGDGKCGFVDCGLVPLQSGASSEADGAYIATQRVH
jgi:hypothetical protein